MAKESIDVVRVCASSRVRYEEPGPGKPSGYRCDGCGRFFVTKAINRHIYAARRRLKAALGV